jgi:uncharacterized protein
VIYLLDVNVLMALLWTNHERHELADRWFEKVVSVATCPVVQLGFARVSSHPQLGFGFSPEDAFSILREFTGNPRHRFIADSLGCHDRVFDTGSIKGPNQVTDHYLVALARQHGLSLATFDEPLANAFAGPERIVSLIR